MDNVIDDIAKLIEATQEEYDKEYRSPILNIVTTVKDKAGDRYKRQSKDTEKVTVVKYYTVKPKEYFANRQYNEHYGTTYQRYTYVVKPRNFYTIQEIEQFLRHIEKLAGRTMEDDEKTLMLRHITNGRRYELTCLIDRTREFKEQTMWQDNK